MAPESKLRPLLRLLGSRPRLYLLFALVEPPKNAGELANAAGVTLASARYHLHKLVDAGLVVVDDRSIPRLYRPSKRVQIVRSRGNTEYHIEAGGPERIIFSIPDTNSSHKSRKQR